MTRPLSLAAGLERRFMSGPHRLPTRGGGALTVFPWRYQIVFQAAFAAPDVFWAIHAGACSAPCAALDAC
jgi:hypothetical protein